LASGKERVESLWVVSIDTTTVTEGTGNSSAVGAVSIRVPVNAADPAFDELLGSESDVVGVQCAGFDTFVVGSVAAVSFQVESADTNTVGW